MRSPAFTLLLLSLLAPLAVAQDFPPVQEGAPPTEQEATPQEGLALVAERTEHDPALVGVTRYGVYLGTTNIGDFTLTVAPVTTQAGAAYQVTARIEVRKPKASLRIEEALLDARFGILSRRTTETADGAEKSIVIRREGEDWVQETTEPGGQPETARLPVGAPDHGDMAAIVLFTRGIDLTQAGQRRLDGVAWGPTPRYRDVLVTIPAATTTRQHRGQEVEVRDVHVDQGDGEAMVLSVTPARELLAMTFQGAPVSMVAGTEEEVAQDLPSGPAAAPAEGTAPTPIAAVRTYFEVAAKLKPVDALDGVMDWAAIRDQMRDIPGGEMLASMSPDGVAQVLKTGMEQSPASFGEDELGMIMMMMQTTEEGDVARVEMPGAPTPFVLRRVEGKWRVTGLPH